MVAMGNILCWFPFMVYWLVGLTDDLSGSRARRLFCGSA
jgi:hypothetical protein